MDLPCPITRYLLIQLLVEARTTLHVQVLVDEGGTFTYGFCDRRQLEIPRLLFLNLLQVIKMLLLPPLILDKLLMFFLLLSLNQVLCNLLFNLNLVLSPLHFSFFSLAQLLSLPFNLGFQPQLLLQGLSLLQLLLILLDLNLLLKKGDMLMHVLFLLHFQFEVRFDEAIGRLCQ